MYIILGESIAICLEVGSEVYGILFYFIYISSVL